MNDDHGTRQRRLFMKLVSTLARSPTCNKAEIEGERARSSNLTRLMNRWRSMQHTYRGANQTKGRTARQACSSDLTTQEARIAGSPVK